MDDRLDENEMRVLAAQRTLVTTRDFFYSYVEFNIFFNKKYFHWFFIKKQKTYHKSLNDQIFFIFVSYKKN
jgi:hypothetical protein